MDVSALTLNLHSEHALKAAEMCLEKNNTNMENKLTRKVTVEWSEDDINVNAMLIAVAGWIKTIADRELLPEQNLELDDEEAGFWYISTEIKRDSTKQV